MLCGYGLISQFAAIDDHVYAAMSSLADRHIENISDLSSKLATYHHDIWAGLSQKGIDNLAGHVGEQNLPRIWNTLGFTSNGRTHPTRQRGIYWRTDTN